MIAPHRSIFVRLLFIYGLSFVAIAAGHFALFAKGGGRGQVFRENIRHYSELLAQEIGSPPNLNKAAELHAKLNLDIAITGPDTNWFSRPEFQERLEEEDDIRHRPGLRPFMLGHSIGRVHQGPYTFYMSGVHVHDETSPAQVVGALALLAIVLGASYASVRYILRPLRRMEQSAIAFGQGDLKSRVPVKGHDELANLARTLNEMAERIEGYIISMQKLLLAISHEFRSPLTRMKVALEFVHNEKIRHSLNEDILLLDRMTEALLETERLRAKPESLNWETVDLPSFLQRLALPYPDLQFETQRDRFEAKIDPSRMSIALRNLIENAFRHGGAAVSLRFCVDNEKAFIEVLDRGPGIPKEQIAHLGEPFFRADPARVQQGGFGLGLSLVYAIVQAHGARIEVEAREGGGTIFRICL